MTAPAAGGAARTVRLGVSLPRLARPTPASLERTLNVCTRLGIAVVEVSIDALEAVLGAQAPTVPLEPPPADGLAFGLLELEEDVLRDSYELAKRSFNAQMRAWRLATPLTPLAALARTWQSAGVAIDVVSVPDLSLWSDDEVDYACRITRAVNARVLSTPLSFGGPRRLTAVARRHTVLLSFTAETTAGTGELDRILESDNQVAVGIDLGTGTTGGHGALLTFLGRRASRVSHVRLADARADGAPVGFGSGEAPVRDVLRAIQDNGWDFPAVVATGQAPDDDSWYEGVTQALAYCRASLEPTV